MCAITGTKGNDILINAFITSQFSYCPHVWMSMNSRINKIYEKVVYKDETNLSFDDLLNKDKSVGIHQRNL